jgi:glycosyltransferase involved in cell wall biosynthesis
MPPDLEFELSLLKDTQIYRPGHVSWKKNIALMSSCTLCITPNIIENYSNAILEAQTLQIPVVAFETGGQGNC